MGSENKINDGTSFEQSDQPNLCANGCGFFGTRATFNLCSKCYSDHCLKEQTEASAKAAVKKSIRSISPPSSPKAEEVEKKASAVAVPAVEEPVKGSSPTAGKANRCGSCNKKVGLMGFKCRCGATFCGSHRYPDEHGCSFDFKGAGRDAISKANPLVKADKVERF